LNTWTGYKESVGDDSFQCSFNGFAGVNWLTEEHFNSPAQFPTFTLPMSNRIQFFKTKEVLKPTE